MAEPKWLQLAVVHAMHQLQIEEHGGLDGVRDAGLLESALARPQNRYAYEGSGIIELAACYAAGIAKNHPFLDGNKRTAFLAAYTFLARNGIRLTATQPEATAAVLALAAGELTESQFARWVAEHSTEL